MRVGLRRLRSALGLFAEVAPCPAALQAELDWLTTALGAARDWEVLAGSTLAVVASACPDEPELVQLQQAAMAVAQENRQKAARAVGSIRYARLLLTLGGWIQGARWRELLVESERGALAAPLVRFAAQTLALCYGKLKKRGKQLRGGAPEARHRVRIAAKKVRYATEFFESLYPAKRVRPFVEALTTLQDALGWLNDAAVAGGCCASLHTATPTWHTAPASSEVISRLCTERDVRKLGKLWQQFTPMQLPCRK